MHRFLLHNDEIQDSGVRALAPGQVGVMNGWGVFSTIRVYDGVLFAWERHWERMRSDAVRMRVPFPHNPAWLAERLLRLVEANHAANATLRVVVIRNRGGAWEGPGLASDFEVVAFTAPVPDWPAGLKLGVVENARHAASEFAGVKVMSWSQNLTWYERAHEQGLDEVVLLNERGEVAECTSANIFVAQGGSVCTPPLSAGCLPGVTRALLLECIRVPGLEILEKTILLEDLETADEVFVTSTTREIVPVVSLQGRRLKPGPGPVQDRLRLAFNDYVKAYVAAHPAPLMVK